MGKKINISPNNKSLSLFAIYTIYDFMFTTQTETLHKVILNSTKRPLTASNTIYFYE